MKISELYLTSFGKFKNKKIELNSGLNIIYGLNESGKTTIHNFIDGMFYGFLRPYVTRAYYKDEHAKYNPWYSNEYKGILKFNQNNEDYTIERVFTKGNEDTKVYLDKTGEDISSEVDIGNTSRIIQPGNYFFGFNDVVFSNTIYINQLKNRTEEDLAKELNDKLANLTTSLDEDISVKRAINYLKNLEKNIGSTRASKSIYAKNIEKIKSLKKEIKKLESIKKDYGDSLLDLVKIENKWENLEKQIEDLKKIYKGLEGKNKLEKYEKAKTLKKEIDIIKVELGELEKYKDISVDEYREIIDLNLKMESLNNSIKSIKEEISNIGEEINKKEKDKDGYIDYNLIKDYKKYRLLEEEIYKLENNDREGNIKLAQLDYKRNEEQSKLYKIILVGGIALIGASLIGAIFKASYSFLLINLIAIPLIIKSRNKLTEYQGLSLRIEDHIKDLYIYKEESEFRILDLKDRQKNILKTYKIDDIETFENKYNNAKLSLLKIENLDERIKELEKKQASLSEDLISLSRDKYNIENKINDILEFNKFKNIYQFKIALEYKNKYEDLLSKFNNKKEILEAILENQSLDELKEDLNNRKLDIGKQNLEGYDILDLGRRIQLKEAKARKLEVEYSRLKERVRAYNEYSQSLRNFKEELNRLEREREKLDRKLESIGLAKTNIKKLSRKIHREFAPEINSKVASIIDEISDGRYKEIKIDDKLNIKVVDPGTGKLTDIEYLSGGTIDQLYFALRLGITSTTEDMNLPLILDDCFTQYDDNRLENILNYLSKEALDRQIILFTCQSREREILDKNKISYNLVEI